MAQVTERMREGGRRAVRGLGKVRAGLRAGEVDELRARVAELESEMQEARELNLRLAELVDVVEELVLPYAQRDEKRIAEALERYAKGL